MSGPCKCEIWVSQHWHPQKHFQFKHLSWLHCFQWTGLLIDYKLYKAMQEQPSSLTLTVFWLLTQLVLLSVLEESMNFASDKEWIICYRNVPFSNVFFAYQSTLSFLCLNNMNMNKWQMQYYFQFKKIFFFCLYTHAIGYPFYSKHKTSIV